MDKVTSLDELLRTYRMATSTEDVWKLLEGKLELKNVYLRNLSTDEFFLITKGISGPFTFNKTNDGEEIGAIDLRNNKIFYFRIVQNFEETGAIEVRNEEYKIWFRPLLDRVRIYIPF